MSYIFEVYFEIFELRLWVVYRRMENNKMCFFWIYEGILKYIVIFK